MSRSGAVRGMDGPGGARELAARWHVAGALTLVTACHLGGAVDGPSDMPVVRDAGTGRPVLAGTSIAGALRSHLSDLLVGYAQTEPASVQRLLGAERASDVGDQSPLVVHDALASLRPLLEIRDGVAIDGASGTAARNAKWDVELLPAGTTFELELELDVTVRGARTRTRGEHELELLELLAAALGGFEAAGEECGAIALGSRSSRGLGRCRVDCWHVARRDLTDADGWIALACDDAAQVVAAGSSAAGALGTALDGRPLQLPTPSDARHVTQIDVELAFDGAVLVRSAPTTVDASAADAVQLSSGGKPVMPGTSLTGALRAQAVRIARAIDPATAAERVESLFGGAPSGSGGPGRRKRSAPRPSALRVSESDLSGGRPNRASRIRIDRFTRAVMRGALFDEEPLTGAALSVQLELRHSDGRDPPALGLLLLAVRDLIDGLVPLGGTVAVGRGAIDPARSSATVTFADGASTPLREPAEDAQARLDELVRALHRGAELSAGGSG